MADKKVVFIVEDEQASAAVLTAVLSPHYQVKHAKSAKSTLEAVEKGEVPDIFVVDVGLPDINGYDLCRKLRANPKTVNVPVIFLTGNDDAKAEDDAFRAGGSDFIRKPPTAVALLARINIQLGLVGAKQVLEAEGEKSNWEQVIAKIKQFAETNVKEGGGADVKSRLHVINLAPIRDIFSKRWEALEKKILFIVESSISSTLIKGEVFKYFGELLFAVVYPTLNYDEGKVRARVLAEQICLKILGEEFNSGKYGADLVSKLLDFDLYNEEKKLKVKPKPGEEDLEALKARLLSEISFEYTPIWSPESRFVEGWRVTFLRQYYSKQLRGRNILHGGARDPMWPDVYGALFNEMVERIESTSNGAPYYIISVHIDFLLSSVFVKVIEKYLGNPKLRKRLYVELLGVDDNIKLSLLKAAVMLVGNFSSKIMARISPDSHVVHELIMLGVMQIGLSLQDLCQCGLGKRGAYVVASHFAKKSHLLRFKSYVWGVNDAPDFQITNASGFDLFSGVVFETPSGSAGAATYPFSPALIVKGGK